MTVVLIISIFLLLIYMVLIIYYRRGWVSVPSFRAPSKPATTKISVIIPARNEERNIKACLDSISNQSYPVRSYEVLVVNDHSTDRTPEIVESYTGQNINLINLDEYVGEALNSYKKKSIEIGVKRSTGDLIVTTDADCTVPVGWLQTISAFYELNEPAFIAAPVSISCSNRFIEKFQALDFMVLQGITGAAVHNKVHSMCNGANLAYERAAFEAVNGFEGIDNIASGDDMLLMHKINSIHPDKVHYIKSENALITTHTAKTWNEFFNQRIRWASKANKYDDKRIFWVLLLVYLFNFSFLCLFIAGFVNYYYWFYLFYLWVAKTIVEFPFVFSIASFFKKQSLMKYFFFFQPLHVCYTIIAGWLGQFGSYEWKGRKVK